MSQFKFNAENLIDLQDSDLSLLNNSENLENNQLLKNNINNNSSPFTCIICGKCYRYKQHLKRHVDFECGKEPMFECPHCLKRFHQKANLKRHVVTVHFKEFIISNEESLSSF